MKKIIIISLIISLTANTANWQQELATWKQDRVERLKEPHGWLSLIGMEWLHKGKNTIGAAADNDIVLPHGEAYMGVFNFIDNKIIFRANQAAKISANNELITDTIEVAMDTSGSPTIFTIDSFKFYVIERGKPALRIKDSQAETRINFKGLSHFPISEKFLIKAQFIPYKPAKDIEIVNVLGLLSKEKAIGKLSFAVAGKQYQLDAMDADDELYIIFADRTSGRSTYGPGRFLLVPKPKGGNMTTINFHKAYNPPCAFTDYSTCPLPPPQNRIRTFIEAGEKKYR